MAGSNLRVGLCGIGLEAYWPQFEGLEDRLQVTCARSAKSWSRPARWWNSWVWSTPRRKAAKPATLPPRRCRPAGHLRHHLRSLQHRCCPWCSAPTCRSSSSTCSPTAAIDYQAFNRLPNRTAMTGEWLAYCSACPVPEIANVLRRAGIRVPPGHRRARGRRQPGPRSRNGSRPPASKRRSPTTDSA